MPSRSGVAPVSVASRVRAFTLVELLVVMGIIALLISILLPSLSKARESSRTVACLSNVKQILTAFQAYSTDNKGKMCPCGYYPNGYWWTNILVDGGYLSAPDATGAAGPIVKGVLFCPAANTDGFTVDLTNNTGVPASRTDDRGAVAERHVSDATKTSVDDWYGINSEDSDTGTAYTGAPSPRLIVPVAGKPIPFVYDQSQITKPTEMVLIFDGVGYHHMSVNANRLNARHAGKTVTNLGFFDGHAASFQTKTLPGGVGVAATADFSLANLKANFPPPAPMWRLDQQY